MRKDALQPLEIHLVDSFCVGFENDLSLKAVRIQDPDVLHLAGTDPARWFRSLRRITVLILNPF